MCPAPAAASRGGAATFRAPSKTSSSLAVSRIRTRAPISRAGTEYRHLPTLIRANLSARGHSTVPVSNPSPGSGPRNSCPAAKSAATAARRYSMSPPSSVPSEKGLWRPAALPPGEALPGVRERAGEQGAGRPLAGQHDARRPEVPPRLGTGLLGLRDVPRHAARPRPVLRLDAGPPRPRVLAHVRIRHRHPVLIGQPLPDPPP